MPSGMKISVQKYYNVMASLVPVTGTLLLALIINLLANVSNDPRSIFMFAIGFLGFAFLGLWTRHYAMTLKPRIKWEPKAFKAISVMHFILSVVFFGACFLVRIL